MIQKYLLPGLLLIVIVGSFSLSFLNLYEYQLSALVNASLTPDGSPTKFPTLLVLSETGLQTKLSKEFTQYRADVQRELPLQVVFDEVSPNAKVSDIQKKIFGRFRSTTLKGVLLVGNIPSGKMFHPDVDPGSIFNSEGYILGDYIYQDIFNKCLYYPDKDAYSYEDQECQSGILTQPYWISRITPNSTKTDSLTLLKDYFNRNHAFRTGKKTYKNSVLVYAPILLDRTASEREREKQTFLDQAHFGNLFDGKLNIIDSELETSDIQYKTAVNDSGGQSILFFNGHGLPTFHQKNFSTETGMGKDGNPLPDRNVGKPNVFFTFLNSCSVGRFTTPDYLAGEYLFGNGLLMLAASTPTFGSYHFDTSFYTLLMRGLTVSDALSYYRIGGANLFGDPTLHLPADKNLVTTNMKVTGNKIVLSSKTSAEIKIKNIGVNPLYLKPDLILNKQQNSSFFEGNSYSTNSAFQYSADRNYYTVAPGVEGIFTFDKDYVFSIKPGLPKGIYTATFFIISNDKNMPFMKIPITFDNR